MLVDWRVLGCFHGILHLLQLSIGSLRLDSGSLHLSLVVDNDSSVVLVWSTQVQQERPNKLGGTWWLHGCQPKNRGKTTKMDGKKMENPIKMDDLGWFSPLFFGNTHIYNIYKCDLVRRKAWPLWVPSSLATLDPISSKYTKTPSRLRQAFFWRITTPCRWVLHYAHVDVLWSKRNWRNLG